MNQQTRRMEESSNVPCSSVPPLDILITLRANCPPLRCLVFVLWLVCIRAYLVWAPNQKWKLQTQTVFVSKQNILFCFVQKQIQNKWIMGKKLNKHLKLRNMFLYQVIIPPPPLCDVWPDRGPGSNWWLTRPCLLSISLQHHPPLTSPSLQRLQSGPEWGRQQHKYNKECATQDKIIPGRSLISKMSVCICLALTFIKNFRALVSCFWLKSSRIHIRVLPTLQRKFEDIL